MNLTDLPEVQKLLKTCPAELSLERFALEVERVAHLNNRPDVDSSNFINLVKEYPMFPMLKTKSWLWNLQVLQKAFVRLNIKW